MKRFLTTLFFCSSLLAALSFWLFSPARAEENPIITLLNLPAPPPPNPLVQMPRKTSDPAFYRTGNPPPDDAPIEDLLDYWKRQNRSSLDVAYQAEPSDRALQRILAEIEKNPETLGEYLRMLPDNNTAVDFVKRRYDELSAGDEGSRSERQTLKNWLMRNSSHFSTDLARLAGGVRDDAGGYLSNHHDLLALVRHDWAKARPIVERLAANPNEKVSYVMSKWAFYRQAIASDSLGDIERYRDELKAIVEDKSLTPGQRDLALDALVLEKEWNGRDEWHDKLMEDETLVDMPRFTGLTTIVANSPEEKYIDRMLGLLKSDNLNVRSAAARNLIIRISVRPEEIVRALLPWLENSKWLKNNERGREQIIDQLQNLKIPESVPGLIAALDEKETVQIPRYASNANASVAAAMARADEAMANAAAQVANAVNMAANAANAYEGPTYTTNSAYAANRISGSRAEVFPLRFAAISALSKQADMRAGPALRRILPEVQEYERPSVVRALLSSNAFTVEEQVEAIEMLAKHAAILDDPNSNTNSPARIPGVDPQISERAKQSLQSAMYRSRSQVAGMKDDSSEDEDDGDEGPVYGEGISGDAPPMPPDFTTTERGLTNYSIVNAAAANGAYANRPLKPLGTADMKIMLAAELVAIDDVDEQLVRAMVERIGIHDRKDPALAQTLRRVMLGWKGTALNALLLRDLKNGKLDADAIVKLLSIRKELREKQPSDVNDIRSGNAAAVGLSACILEDPADYEAALNAESEETRTATLACARLIRARLPIEKVAANLQSKNRLLATAAERYLESEDSPEARSIVISLYPNQAKILGATTSFNVQGISAAPGQFLNDLFVTVSPYYAAAGNIYESFGASGDFASVEKRLQKEVAAKPDLLGVYSYENNFIRIYKDKAVLSWEDDPARYRERVLEKEEFDNLKGFLAHHKVDQLPPFLACTEDCDARQLLMLGRSGGRRVFVKASTMPEFFAALDAMFAEMKSRPATLKYWAVSQIPGLEVLFAGEKHDAQTVWKNGGDLRVLVTDKAVKSRYDPDAYEAMIEEESDEEETEKPKQTGEYDGYAWFTVTGGNLAAATAQPAEAEYIPIKDSLEPAAVLGQWKAKTATVEIRADESGLYAIRAGRSVKIRDGHYFNPVVTPNGRWAVVSKINEDYDRSLVRVNLFTKQEFKLSPNELYVNRAVAYIASLNRVLVTGGYMGEYEDETESAYEDDGTGYYLLNPETGAVQPSVGEVRPLAQQTFRALQPTAVPTEFWAAMPRGRKETLVGIYNTRNFGFKPMLRLPKIVFDSMDMWVDAGSNKVFFVYEGHVLSAPLAPIKQS